MYTKFDKIYTNYLNNNSICNSCTSTDETKITEDDDSLINSLPDVNEIEKYDIQSEFQADDQVIDFNIVNKYFTTPKANGMILTSRSSISSTSSSVSLSSNSSKQAVANDLGTISSHSLQPNKKNCNRNIHCVKEKIRRDRIKFSCNELRRLLPNLNGVKTDMASLLETSVNWIQLINDNIPEQLLFEVQNKLDGLKHIRRSRQNSLNQKSSLLTAPPKNLDLKQKTNSSNPIQIFNSDQTQSSSPLNVTSNTSFVSSLDTATNNFNKSTCTLQQHHQQSKNNHFISKPSKWLYSSTDLFHHDLNNNDIPEYRCFIPGSGQNQNQFNSDSNFHTKVAKKLVESNNNSVNNTNKSNYNNNSMYLGQVLFSDQLGIQQTAYSENNQASFQQGNQLERSFQPPATSQILQGFYNQTSSESMF